MSSAASAVKFLDCGPAIGLRKEHVVTYDDANGLTDNPHVLWWNAPARRWDHGMPIGSGRLGVMVIGRLGQEELHLNEETIWSRELVDRTNPDARAALDEVRALLRAGKPQHAMAIASSRMMGAPNRLSPYQPLGSLIVRLPLEQGDRVEDYVRWLDMQRGIAGVRYRIGDVTYQRELFASAVDDVIVARFSASKPGSITANLSMEREVDAIWSTRAPDRAELEGQAGRNGVRFAAITQVRTDGVQLTRPASALQVEGAQAMTVLIACGTDFHGKDPRQQAETALAGAISRTYEELRDRHTSDHRRLYDRVELTLADSDAGAHDALPTDQRLGRVVEGGEDAGLAAKLFQFGRYLLISSSRPGNLPANLQGIWNHLITPPWKCDYHLNINLQMNYWPAEVCNLSECHTPLFDWLDRIVPSGQHTAEVHYGCRGFVAHHISDPWDFTVPGDSARCGLWPMGGAWCALHAWEHFAYTQDLEFLRRQGWPLLREAAAFFLDFLVEDEQGRLLCGPSSSPENRYRMADGTVGFLCMGPAMDSQILHELFTACRDAATALNEADELVDRISDARDRLPQPRIGKHGQIMEWLEDYDEPEPGHRHVSQLFAVYPGHQIKVHTTP